MISDTAPAEVPGRPPRSGLSLIFVGLAIGFALFLLYRIERVILALILAVFFAYLITPLVVLAERPLARLRLSKSTARGGAIGVVYFGVCFTVGLAVLLLTPQVSQQASDIVAQAPEYTTAIRQWGDRWTAFERARLPRDLRVRVDEALTTAADAAAVEARTSLVATLGMLTYLPWLVLIPVLTFFLLKDLDILRYHAVQALPSRFRGPGYRLVQELNTALAAYVRGQLVACLIVGAICGLGFALLGVPYAVLLAVLAAVLEFIPLVGPLVVAIVAAVIAGVHAPILALWVVLFLMVVRILEDYVIYPRLMGHGTHLHPLAVIVAVLIGIELGGIVGVFLAVPVASALLVAYRHWIDWRQAHQLEPRGSPPDRSHEPTRLTSRS